ncbi:MAG: hypothetical protein KJI71_00075 [Patescibacteria group bacterium]|nr:hypothetical protein [Patescibacteria group bacterium]
MKSRRKEYEIIKLEEELFDLLTIAPSFSGTLKKQIYNRIDVCLNNIESLEND